MSAVRLTPHTYLIRLRHTSLDTGPSGPEACEMLGHHLPPSHILEMSQPPGPGEDMSVADLWSAQHAEVLSFIDHIFATAVPQHTHLIVAGGSSNMLAVFLGVELAVRPPLAMVTYVDTSVTGPVQLPRYRLLFPTSVVLDPASPPPTAGDGKFRGLHILHDNYDCAQQVQHYDDYRMAKFSFGQDGPVNVTPGNIRAVHDEMLDALVKIKAEVSAATYNELLLASTALPPVAFLLGMLSCIVFRPEKIEGQMVRVRGAGLCDQHCVPLYVQPEELDPGEYETVPDTTPVRSERHSVPL